jgi:hypothetical protein
MTSRVGRAIGRGISPVVEALDLDAIVHQIDLEDILLNHVDLNRVLGTVDLNDLLERVDLDQALSNVDMDTLLAKVDINTLIERSNIQQIIARSSMGVCTRCTDMLRSNVAYLDQWIQRFGRLACFSKDPWLPPIPGRSRHSKSGRVPWPKGPVRKRAVRFGEAVQFRCCGIVTRFIAWVIDFFLFTGAYTLVALLFTVIGEAITKEDASAWDDDLLQWLVPTIYVLAFTGWTALCISCLGKTVGMGIVGILLVSNNGHRVGFCQAILRTCVSKNLPLF